jgi:hypothetical protein
MSPSTKTTATANLVIMEAQPVVEFKEITVIRKGSQKDAPPTPVARQLMADTTVPALPQRSTVGDSLPPAAPLKSANVQRSAVSDSGRGLKPASDRGTTAELSSASGKLVEHHAVASSSPPPLPRRRVGSETAASPVRPPSAAATANLSSDTAAKKLVTAFSGSGGLGRSVTAMDPSVGGLSGEEYVRTLPQDGRRSTQGIPEVGKLNRIAKENFCIVLLFV